MALSDDELLSIVKRESDNAEQYITSEIAEERDNALERYLGERYGDEVAGRSAVLSLDVMETVEWAMPSLLKVFASGENVVQYNPRTPEDEDFAEQATDYANYVFYTENNGFLILNTMFKDALISKLGVVKSYWSEEEKTEYTEFSGLNDEEYRFLIAQDGVEVVAHSAYTMDGIEVVDDDDDSDLGERENGDGEITPGEMALAVMQPLVHEVEIKRTIKDGKIETVNIPPEEFFISRNGADPDKADYLEHATTMSATQLVAMGIDKDIVDGLPADDTADRTGEKDTRFGQVDNTEHADKAMRQITVHESYVMADIEESGVAQRVRVLWAGDTVLEQEKVTHQPFSVVCPIPIPHRAHGMSLADIVVELARIKTVITRQTLDNLYLSNNPEREVVIDQIVSMDDLLMSRPGGIKRVKTAGAIREISVPFVAQHSFAMLDGLDGMISKRTGISDAVTGIDANVLANETATASNNNMAAANQRLEMITRIFAETGVKHLFKTYLRLMVEHQDQPKMIRLRGEWVQMDPSSWNVNMDVSVDVGLGHGNKDQQVSHLANLLNWQKEMLASGGVQAEGGQPMVKPKHIYNTFEKIIQAIGFKSIDPFMDDPGDGALPQPEQQQDPNAALIQGQMQIEQLKAQSKQAEVQAKMSVEERKAQREHELAVAKVQLEQEKLSIEREKIAAGMQETAAKIEADKEKAAAQLVAQAQLTRFEADDRAKGKMLDISEKALDRDHAMQQAMQKAQKQVSIQRNDDGSLVGMVTE